MIIIINDVIYITYIAEFEEFETLKKLEGRKHYYKSISIFRFYKSYVKTKIILLSNNDNVLNITKNGNTNYLKVKINT
ncbi:hypothetical protein ACK2GQ_22065 [Clostridioides difficile]